MLNPPEGFEFVQVVTYRYVFSAVSRLTKAEHLGHPDSCMNVDVRNLSRKITASRTRLRGPRVCSSEILPVYIRYR